jgi:hypothetical protein
LDVIGPFHVVDVLPGSSTVDQFGLVEPLEAFGQGIIVGVAYTPHAVDDAGFGQSFGISNCEILHAPVAV